MVIKILPPDEAKKKVREKVAAWKRKKECEQMRIKEGIIDITLDMLLLDEAADPDSIRFKEVLDAGVDIEVKDDKGLTALMIASLYGNTRAVELLIAKGANVNARADDGTCALMHASFTGNTAIAELLLRTEKETGKTVRDKEVAMQLASGNGHVDIVELLRRYGAKE